MSLMDRFYPAWQRASEVSLDVQNDKEKGMNAKKIQCKAA